MHEESWLGLILCRALMKQKSGNVEALFLRGKAFYLLGEREAAVKYAFEDYIVNN